MTSKIDCAVAINVSNSPGNGHRGGDLSKDGSMIGTVRNQANVPMQVTAFKIW